MRAEEAFDLRQARSFVAVAKHRSFTNAARDLNVSQQAVSQHVSTLERSLAVKLLRRTSRTVELTPEGAIFLPECRRVLSAAARATRRVQSAARGEAGTIRIAYTLTTVWDTIPVLLAELAQLYPQLTVDPREVFGGDIAEALLADRIDLAIAPMTSYHDGFRTQTIRREPMCVALADDHALAHRSNIELPELRDERFEIWPREMAPGFYDTVVGACRAAGFEPRLDQHGAGNTVWRNIAGGRGIGLINGSLAEQLPRRITLVDLSPPGTTIAYDAVWHEQTDGPTVQKAIEATKQLSAERNWL